MKEKELTKWQIELSRRDSNNEEVYQLKEENESLKKNVSKMDSSPIYFECQ
jgi:hypothetical protein